MGSKRLFDVDPLSGLATYYEDLGGDDFAVHTVQDVEPILESNKAKKSMGREYYAQSNDMWRAASIPASVQLKWLIEEGIDIFNADHMPRVKAKLNDSEYMHLKTADIRI